MFVFSRKLTHERPIKVGRRRVGAAGGASAVGGRRRRWAGGVGGRLAASALGLGLLHAATARRYRRPVATPRSILAERIDL